MARGEPSYYCCICGCPFTPDGLRKATTASSGEDECDFVLFKDYCDCGADNYYGGSHDESCAVLKGYDGDLLPSGRIAWLMHARMICARAGSYGLVHANHEPSLCFVTGVGVLVPKVGFVCSEDFGPIWPMEEGFIVHEACWGIFGLVYKTKFPSRDPINLSHLWLSMCIRSPPSRGTVVDWGSSYGGAAKFHGKHWDARQGSEWLVADPAETIDFTQIIDASTTDSLVANVPHSTLLLQYRDPFFHLPVEIICNILDFLPGRSIVNLMVASISVRESGGSLWKTRLARDVPWQQRTSLYKSLGNRRSFIQYGTLLNLLENISSSSKDVSDLKHEKEWLGLKSRRRIWTCCEKIIDDVESRFATARSAGGFPSKEMEALSTFRIATVIKPDRNEERCAADVYFVPTRTSPPSLQTITVYFLPEGSVIGIEFSLDGERSGRVLGHRSTDYQSATIHSGVVINGFVLSLGPEFPVVRDRPIKGLGILTEDSPLKPQFRFGTWTGHDMVQVFRPVCRFPNSDIKNQQVVGLTGQYNAQKIFTFGIIVAVFGTPDIDPYRLDIYSRWINNWPPTHHLEPRHGCSIRFDAPYMEPVIHEIHNTYVSVVKCALTSVHAYYPYGDGNPLGGLKFTFVDGSDQLVGRTDHDPGVQANVELILDAENGEEISAWSGYFGRHTDDGCPLNLYSLKLETSLGRSIDLGNTDAFDIEHGFGFGIVSPYRILGFQIGASPPWIESFSWVVGLKDKALEEP